MKNRTNTRRCGRTYNVLSAKTLILAGFAVIIALGISSLALHTRTAATQELDKNMPTLKGDAAIELLKKEMCIRDRCEAHRFRERGEEQYDLEKH